MALREIQKLVSKIRDLASKNLALSDSKVLGDARFDPQQRSQECNPHAKSSNRSLDLAPQATGGASLLVLEGEGGSI